MPTTVPQRRDEARACSTPVGIETGGTGRANRRPLTEHQECSTPVGIETGGNRLPCRALGSRTSRVWCSTPVGIETGGTTELIDLQAVAGNQNG